jgi:DNA repair/transcription protein MET18/MMS19
VYLSSKLDDHYTVSTAALPGLNQLLTQYQPAGDNDDSTALKISRSIDIIRAILKEIHVQSMVQADRYLTFSMCKFVLSSDSLVSEIKAQSYDTDFVFGFIQSMDSEKDPRNLLICFECIKLLGQRLNLGPFVDETFEVFACYFPIDFNPVK